MMDLKSRLLARIEIDAQTSCWNWTGSKRSELRPYGRLTIGSRKSDRRTVAAHRLSFEVFKGVDPGDLCVCHACDNPRCINPDHLWLGTKKDNADDRDQKGRNKLPPKYTGVISDETISLIRSSDLTSRKLSKVIGVSDAYIRQIRRSLYRPTPPANQETET
jgi:hypothetical protein